MTGIPGSNLYAATLRHPTPSLRRGRLPPQAIGLPTSHFGSLIAVSALSRFW